MNTNEKINFLFGNNYRHVTTYLENWLIFSNDTTVACFDKTNPTGEICFSSVDSRYINIAEYAFAAAKEARHAR